MEISEPSTAKAVTIEGYDAKSPAEEITLHKENVKIL